MKTKLPKLIERLHFSLLRLKYLHRPYREYYEAVMEYGANNYPESATGAKGDEIGKRQLRRLMMYGLMPSHTFLDIGCGGLRGGIFVIEYLDKGNYTGNDISASILEYGEKLLKERRLEYKSPHLYKTDNLEFKELEGKKFDYIHAQSVLTHMPPKDVEILIRNVPKVMHKNSIFLTTIFKSKTGSIYDRRQKLNFYYPLSWMVKICESSGLKVEEIDDDREYIGKQTLLKITTRMS